MGLIRSWALTLSVLLIVTGIVMKTVPESSTKRTVKFVASLLIITCFFRLDLSAAINELSGLDFNFHEETVNELNENLQEKILTDFNSKIREKTDEILKKYDKDSFSLIEFNESAVKVTVYYKSLSISSRIELEKEIETFLENEITFEYSAVREND